MVIAVISDTHNNKSSITRLKESVENVDAIIFLGDGESDLIEITKGFEGEVYAVRGNCDVSNRNPEEQIIEIKGVRIFMCHGHRYSVKYGYNSIFYRAKELDVDIVLFGHSHLPIIEEQDGLILMNPGSASHCVGRLNKTIGFIDIVDEKQPIAYIREL